MITGLSDCLMDLGGSHILLDQVILACTYILTAKRECPYSYSPLPCMQVQ